MSKEWLIVAGLFAAAVPFGSLAGIVIFVMRRGFTQIDQNSLTLTATATKLFSKIDKLTDKVGENTKEIAKLEATKMSIAECQTVRDTCVFPQFSQATEDRFKKIEGHISTLKESVNA